MDEGPGDRATPARSRARVRCFPAAAGAAGARAGRRKLRGAGHQPGEAFAAAVDRDDDGHAQEPALCRQAPLLPRDGNRRRAVGFGGEFIRAPRCAPVVSEFHRHLAGAGERGAAAGARDLDPAAVHLDDGGLCFDPREARSVAQQRRFGHAFCRVRDGADPDRPAGAEGDVPGRRWAGHSGPRRGARSASSASPGVAPPMNQRSPSGPATA
jgi:hypothetical protein